MRLRLVLLVSLVGTIVGSGIPIVISILVYGSMIRAAYLRRFVATGNLIDLIPFIVAIVGAVFVYRHTARRRKLQAALAGVLIVLLSWMVLIASVALL